MQWSNEMNIEQIIKRLSFHRVQLKVDYQIPRPNFALW